MNSYEKHAHLEFKAAGWLNEDGSFKDSMQEMICNHVLMLLEVFDSEGHSGSSAPYAINLFSTLAKFEPIVPLTGEDWEWNDVSEGSGKVWYQNNRCSRVFKDDKGAYDSEGKVFYSWETNEKGEKYKSHYTCRDSIVYVTFPYTPTHEYIQKL